MAAKERKEHKVMISKTMYKVTAIATAIGCALFIGGFVLSLMDASATKAKSNIIKSSDGHCWRPFLPPADHHPEYPLYEKILVRDTTNVIGCYMGMIAEFDQNTYRYNGEKNLMITNDHPEGVMMFSATSGAWLKWISYDDFKAIFVDKTRLEYH